MTALITGGSSGLGLEFARQLAERGYDLILVSNRADELDSAAAEISPRASLGRDDSIVISSDPDVISTDRNVISTDRNVISSDPDVISSNRNVISSEVEKSPSVTTLCMDLARTNAADELFEWCSSQGVLPDIIVNDAGMFFFKELTVEDLPRVQAMIDLHVVTVTRICILFGEAMKKRGSGRILNISSMCARIPAPGITIYSATKAYLRSFGRSLSYELKPHGVTVTTVCPAAVATPLYRLSERQMRAGLRLGLVRTPRWLVRRSLRALFRGRRVLSPAFMNLWLPFLIVLLPGPLIARLWKKLK